ncbi:MAG: hypothetical protein GT601_09625 [Acidaminobacter sp.]|uniref:metallophosphoesterase family protein n=1 Tax=Acidaminobacter sp. TaxID=1872102 RepID=UPI0013808283|nr:DNA repair exonuclease [Acidaminobacter sp.]MZQ97928.1 hypothetical protein [Acidaminobacter sp.]
MVQILHLGDCHFDDAYYLNRPERKRLLDECREEALRAAVETAVDRQVDLFVWAGDLLDGERRISLKTRSMLEQALSDLEGAKVEMAWMTGNHDPKSYLEAQSLDQLLEAHGVHLFDGKVREVMLKARNGMPYKLVGSGHEERGLVENRVRTYPVKADGVLTIGLLHGSVQGSALTGGGAGKGEDAELPPGLEPGDLYFPCTKADLTRLGYDLICLGHVHVPYKIEMSGAAAFYAGSLTGLSHKEAGVHGAWLHTLGYGAVKSRFLELSTLEWKTVQIAVTPELSLTQFVELVQTKTETQIANPGLTPYLERFDNGSLVRSRSGADELSISNQRSRLMLRLSISGVNDTILTAIRHDPETLRDRIGNAVNAAEVEIRSDMVPERVLELQRTGDTFAAHLNTCLEDPEFMANLWAAYAQRALTFEAERPGLEDDNGFRTGLSDEDSEAQLLKEALHDLWPRWMQPSRRMGGDQA